MFVVLVPVAVEIRCRAHGILLVGSANRFKENNNQKKKYAISIFTLGMVAFISPIVQESINKNKCVKETKIYLKENSKAKDKKGIKSYFISVNHCYGGDYFSSNLVE